jgi:hypothetical protein
MSETPEVAILEVMKTVCENWPWFDAWADAIIPEKP